MLREHTWKYKLAVVMACGATAILTHGRVAYAAGTGVSAREYRLYKDWENGREDPRLVELAPDAQLRKIARSLGVSAKALQQTVDKVAPLASAIGGKAAERIKGALAQTSLAGRISEVHVDAGQGHVVAGVKWRCGDARDVEKEASYAAWAVSEGGDVVQTLLVWCVNEADAKLFSATIGRDAFERISKPRIERFAKSRYIRLFEEVKIGPHH